MLSLGRSASSISGGLGFIKAHCKLFFGNEPGADGGREHLLFSPCRSWCVGVSCRLYASIQATMNATMSFAGATGSPLAGLCATPLSRAPRAGAREVAGTSPLALAGSLGFSAVRSSEAVCLLGGEVDSPVRMAGGGASHARCARARESARGAGLPLTYVPPLTRRFTLTSE